MDMSILLRGVAALLLTTFAARAATPGSVDYSDLWWNAQESGWGLSLFHQENVIFGTLFVYGPDGKGTWYAASGMRPVAGASVPTYSSPLYRTRGPAYTNPTFDPATVVVTTVGELSMRFDTAYSATLTYNVGSVRVVKQVTRQTWNGKRLGPLKGGISAAPRTCNAGVPALPLEIRGTWARNTYFGTQTFNYSNGACTISGAYEQAGRLGRVAGGTLQCVQAGSAPYTAAVTIEELEANEAGMNGAIRVVDPFCTYEGSFGGNLVAGYSGSADGIVGMWWNPLESGYGVGVHFQGGIAFVTLYTYGLDGEPAFFVGPSIVYPPYYLDFPIPPPLPPQAMYRTEGTYFGAPFLPAATKAIPVGTLAAPDISGSTYLLSTTLDGTLFTDSLQRLAFAESSMAGRYLGGIDVYPSRCVHPSYDGRIAVQQQGDRVTLGLSFVGISGSVGSCTLTATSRSDGQRISLSAGQYSCDANDGGAAHTGTFTASSVELKQHGFSGFFNAEDSRGCGWFGNIGAIRSALP